MGRVDTVRARLNNLELDRSTNVENDWLEDLLHAVYIVLSKPKEKSSKSNKKNLSTFQFYFSVLKKKIFRHEKLFRLKRITSTLLIVKWLKVRGSFVFFRCECHSKDRINGENECEDLHEMYKYRRTFVNKTWRTRRIYSEWFRTMIDLSTNFGHSNARKEFLLFTSKSRRTRKFGNNF